MSAAHVTRSFTVCAPLPPPCPACASLSCAACFTVDYRLNHARKSIRRNASATTLCSPDEELPVACGPRQTGVREAVYLPAQGIGHKAGQAQEYFPVNGGPAHDSLLTDEVPAGFELGLDQQERPEPRGTYAIQCRQHRTQRDERHIHGEEVRPVGKGVFGEVTRIHRLYDGNTGIVPESRMDLPFADVESDDVQRSGLQEAVGESSRTRSHIEGVHPSYIQAEHGESVGEFVSATGDEAGTALHPDGSSLTHLGARFVQHQPVNLYPTGHDESPGLAARGRQVERDDQLIESTSGSHASEQYDEAMTSTQRRASP